ncbi:MAG TPA: YciI family protein [Polyangiaceae bacterium]|nr:YciI family protein [Polyangiaceae bacterium]
MFIVVLRLSDNRVKAAELMPAHNDWITRGMEDDVFLLVGSLRPAAGGAIVAHNTTRSELEVRVSQDPFVANDVVSADVLEISCSRADPRLSFLLG